MIFAYFKSSAEGSEKALKKRVVLSVANIYGARTNTTFHVVCVLFNGNKTNLRKY